MATGDGITRGRRRSIAAVASPRRKIGSIHCMGEGRESVVQEFTRRDFGSYG